MDLTGQDLDNVTRTILGEVGQKGTPAETASVASVIRNRLAVGRYGGSPTDIVHAPNQFEPWNPGSGNDPRRFPADSPAYKQAQALAQGVFNGTIQDQTNGATHFVAPASPRIVRVMLCRVGLKAILSRRSVDINFTRRPVP
jgi:spore germination cell wall hydrolase CwlJ-like protein